MVGRKHFHLLTFWKGDLPTIRDVVEPFYNSAVIWGEFALSCVFLSHALVYYAQCEQWYDASCSLLLTSKGLLFHREAWYCSHDDHSCARFSCTLHGLLLLWYSYHLTAFPDIEGFEYLRCALVIQELPVLKQTIKFFVLRLNMNSTMTSELLPHSHHC